MARHIHRCPLVVALLGLAALASGTRAAHAQDPVRWSQHVPGDSKPFALDADDVSTWVEGEQRVILLRGKVLVEHGTMRLRADQAVVWIDQGSKLRTGIYQMAVVALGGVSFEHGLEVQQSAKASLDLSTRGEVKVKAHLTRVSQTPMPGHPLYLQARAERGLPPPVPVARVSSGAAPAGVPGGVQRTSGFTPTGGVVPAAAASPVSPAPVPAAPPAAQPLYQPPAPPPYQPAYQPAYPPAPAPAPGGPRSALPVSPSSPSSLAGPAGAPPAALPPAAPPAAPPSSASAGGLTGGGDSFTLPSGTPLPSGTLLSSGPDTPPGPPAARGSTSLQPRLGSPTGVPVDAAVPGPGPLVPEPPAGGPPPVVGGPPPVAPPVIPPVPPPARRAISFTVAPRTSAQFDTDTVPLPDGSKADVITGGVIVTVTDPASGLLDIEADRVVIWRKADGAAPAAPVPGADKNQQVEFYLSGNVELRQVKGLNSRVLRCEELYYDVGRSVAVAIHADMLYRQRGQIEPAHLKGEEILQISPDHFLATKAEISASKLPSDPKMVVYVSSASLEESKVVKTNLFGQPVFDRKTHQPIVIPQGWFRGKNFFLDVLGVPVFYFPFIQGDPHDPLGPLQSFTINWDQMYGTQIKTTWNAYDLFGIAPYEGTSWHAYFDYLSYRGPALGTQFDFVSKDFFGIVADPGERPVRQVGTIKAYGIEDEGIDILGGNRNNIVYPQYRGRFLFRDDVQNLPDGFTVQAQVSAISDHNFLEEYYKTEFDIDINSETFLYVAQEKGTLAWTALTEINTRRWVTETSWLPRLDGYAIGQSPLDFLTYSVHGSAGFGELHIANGGSGNGPGVSAPISVTDRSDSTGRFDLIQELSLPFSAGDLKVVPYGVLDLTEYTRDLAGESRGRFYVGGGVRASLPLSRLYPDVKSLPWNLDGLYHKIVFSGNYYVAHSDTPFTMLPQLDRVNDDPSDQSVRDITPLQPLDNPGHGVFIVNNAQTGNLFDPQAYILRRLNLTAVDTIDTIEELQGSIQQRLQTKRGYPGAEHTVDWMTLDVSGTIFPNPNRDNVGNTFGILQFNYNWAIGDRTEILSDGWMDPGDQSARVFGIGVSFSRPDRTAVVVSYRQLYPLESQALSVSLNYVFSPRYMISLSTTYDFGIVQTVGSSAMLTRTGSDAMISFGVSYSALINTFGFQFEIVPNIAANNRQGPRSLDGFLNRR